MFLALGNPSSDADDGGGSEGIILLAASLTLRDLGNGSRAGIDIGRASISFMAPEFSMLIAV